MKPAILNDIELHGILPLQEVLCPAQSGEIPKKYLLPLLASRLAEDAANALPDGSPERADFLSVSDDVENWFRVESNRPGKSTLTSPRPDRPGVRDCGIPPMRRHYFGG
jgi:hypothetical protein